MPRHPERHLERLAQPEAARLLSASGVAVVATGSVEQHGGHLPLGTDAFAALSIAERVADRKLLIAGIRPEHFEDASLVQPDEREHGVTFRATIDVVESMGSDVFVYFTQDGGLSATTDQLADLAADSGAGDIGASDETVTARLDAVTGIKEGDEAELWADIRTMHIFDPDTGANLSLGTEPAEAPDPAAT